MTSRQSTTGDGDGSQPLLVQHGPLISVGRRNGAADLLGVKLKGRLALTIKDLIEWEYRQSITWLQGYSAATVL
jgi:NADH dehydrogenase FAD-containing subunit